MATNEGKGRTVVVGLSGGVDSSVVAALLHRAIGDQLTCVFVDNGLLRLHEGEQVMAMFAENMGVKVIRANAEEQFLNNLAGEADPEKKRKIIGRTFIDVFDAESCKLDNIKYLAQGTIYPDVIESAGAKTGKAHVIKSHHNVGGLPEDMHLKLLEPLRELFKDEVRELGVALGLPREMVYRHPFPGPGLGVRILGEVKRESASLLQRADEALYQAKTAGRDRICLAPDVSPRDAVDSGDPSGLVQLVWRPAYACGNEVIDREHRALFAHANTLLAAMLGDQPVADVSAGIDVLLAGVVEHFKDEEAILAAAGFAGLDAHVGMHQQLVARAMELVALFNQGKLGLGELFQFLADDVVARHMLVEDRKYYALIAA